MATDDSRCTCTSVMAKDPSRGQGSWNRQQEHRDSERTKDKRRCQDILNVKPDPGREVVAGRSVQRIENGMRTYGQKELGGHTAHHRAIDK